MEPLTKRRPTVTDNGDGTYTQTWGAPQTFYGLVEIHGDELRLTADADVDLQQGDVVMCGVYSYAVTGISCSVGAPWQQVKLERTEDVT